MKITIAFLVTTIVVSLFSSFWLADAVTTAHIEMSRQGDKISPGMQILASRADLLCTALIAWVPLSGVVLGLVLKAHKRQLQLSKPINKKAEQGGDGDAEEAV